MLSLFRIHSKLKELEPRSLCPFLPIWDCTAAYLIGCMLPNCDCPWVISLLVCSAGTTALEDSHLGAMPFCGGRTDAPPGDGGPETLQPQTWPDYIKTAGNTMGVMGLTPGEYVALQAMPRSPTQQVRLGYSGSYSERMDLKLTDYFKILLTNSWTEGTSAAGKQEFEAAGPVNGTTIYMMPSDMAVKYNPVLRAAAQEYASDGKKITAAFKAAWTKVMNADRFKGPAGSMCA